MFPKPNLTNADNPPVTTPVEIVEPVYHYCSELCGADIAIGEGCGSGKTIDTYCKNGYEVLDFCVRELVTFGEGREPAFERHSHRYQKSNIFSLDTYTFHCIV